MTKPIGHCVRCGAAFDDWTGVGYKGTPHCGPQPGDPTVCIDCGQAMIFTADMGVRWPTAAEQAQLDRDRLVGTVQGSIHQIHGRRRQ